MTNKKTLDWTCICGHVNKIKLPCVLPNKLTCEKCEMKYWTFQHVIKYISEKGELIEIIRDISEF